MVVPELPKVVPRNCCTAWPRSISPRVQCSLHQECQRDILLALLLRVFMALDHGMIRSSGWLLIGCELSRFIKVLSERFDVCDLERRLVTHEYVLLPLSLL